MVGITINFTGSRNSPGLRTFFTPDINDMKEWMNFIRIRQVLMELQRSEIGGSGIAMGCLRHA
jgi:hypothetical protein